MTGVTFDTGALIALERRRLSARKVFNTALANGVIVTVPVVVVTEWWRGGEREKERDLILRALRVERPDLHLAKAAGVAMGLCRGAGAIDAMVMASASSRGDVVYTSDVEDLTALQAAVPSFRDVKIFAV